MKIRLPAFPYRPVQDLCHGLRLTVPAQVFAGIAHPLLSQAAHKNRIASKRSQNPFDLQHHVVFLRERHFKAELGINNVPGSTEIHHHWYCAHRQSLKDYTASKLVNRRKDQHIGRTEALYDFTMPQAPTERDKFLDPQGPGKLLKAGLLGAPADDGETGFVRLQERSGRSQS